MIVEKNIKKVKNIVANQKKRGNKICLIPTMGALHEGHTFLIKEALKKSEFVWLSIFVNPTQFNDLNDFKNYPKSIKKDISKIKEISENIFVFNPTSDEIYNNNIVFENFDFGNLDKVMEGNYRPNHFNGVATIVAKLFEIFEPDFTFFGEKDFQQVLIIKHLISKKFPKINLVICNTVREKNGLAISSRNKLLNKKIYKKCGLIYDMLVFAKKHIREKDINKIKEHIINKLNAISSFELEYFEIRDSEFLEKIDILVKKQKIRAFICVKVDGVRLIDNMEL
ncbi:MAG: pantoate--beta-alanine ligase [Flavobacteriaceae bacterium]|nr:pantoate--beta-alanine ligase [Flavobacteriaceae bacterium]